MGNRDGRMRFHRRHVSLLCHTAGNRPAYPRRCLHLWVPAASGSPARRLDEIAGENFPRALVQKSKASTGRKTRGRVGMTIGRANSICRTSASLAWSLDVARRSACPTTTYRMSRDELGDSLGKAFGEKM